MVPSFWAILSIAHDHQLLRCNRVLLQSRTNTKFKVFLISGLFKSGFRSFSITKSLRRIFLLLLLLLPLLLPIFLTLLAILKHPVHLPAILTHRTSQRIGQSHLLSCNLFHLPLHLHNIFVELVQMKSVFHLFLFTLQQIEKEDS